MVSSGTSAALSIYKASIVFLFSALCANSPNPTIIKADGIAISRGNPGKCLFI